MENLNAVNGTLPEKEFNPSQGRFIRTNLKKQFLEISRVTREGRFNRVSKEALDGAEALAEHRIRQLFGCTASSPVGGNVLPLPGIRFLTGAGKQRLVEAFERALAADMQRFVNDIRVGKTI